MKFSLGRTNGIVLSVIIVLIIVLVTTWLNSRGESLLSLTVVFVGVLFGMLGGVIYDGIIFTKKDIEKIVCFLLPVLSGGLLVYISQFDIVLSVMLLAILTLISLGIFGACLKRNLPLTNNIALCVGIVLLIVDAMVIYNRFKIPDDYIYFGIGLIMVMTSLGGAWIKDYILIQLGVYRGEK